MSLIKGTFIFNEFNQDRNSDINVLRYRLLPTFGKDTIRRFSTNSSEMKKLAAHNFEDLLQVLILGPLAIRCFLKLMNSAPFLCLKIYCLNHTTLLYWISSS